MSEQHRQNGDLDSPIAIGDCFGQNGFDVRMEWGRRAVRDAAARHSLTIVVDVLSFTTTVATAVNAGVLIYPCALEEDAGVTAQRIGAEAAVPRNDVPASGRFSLSPLTFDEACAGARVVIASPNGAACSRHGSTAGLLFAGSLSNAEATARAANARCGSRSITVVACGERWGNGGDGEGIRFAIEDYLGAGAVISGLRGTRSPEAALCEVTFLAARDRLESLIWESGSGRELRSKGYGDDVVHATRLNTLERAAVLMDGWFRAG